MTVVAGGCPGRLRCAAGIPYELTLIIGSADGACSCQPEGCEKGERYEVPRQLRCCHPSMQEHADCRSVKGNRPPWPPALARRLWRSSAKLQLAAFRENRVTRNCSHFSKWERKHIAIFCSELKSHPWPRGAEPLRGDKKTHPLGRTQIFSADVSRLSVPVWLGL
jgi:hypothetical protein